MVKITVLMAVRDTLPTMLRQAIKSIRGQTLREFELLILDDGSEQAETCAELERQAAGDSRIRLERGPPRGVTATLNRGLALAAGAFIARQDADDWSEPRRLERQMEYVRAHPETTPRPSMSPIRFWWLQTAISSSPMGMRPVPATMRG